MERGRDGASERGSEGVRERGSEGETRGHGDTDRPNSKSKSGGAKPPWSNFGFSILDFGLLPPLAKTVNGVRQRVCDERTLAQGYLQKRGRHISLAARSQTAHGDGTAERACYFTRISSARGDGTAERACYFTRISLAARSQTRPSEQVSRI
jgi:hypothetical protein